MTQFQTFRNALLKAVDYAEQNPNPTKSEKESALYQIHKHCTTGQERILTQVYNSVRETVKYKQELSQK